MTGPLAASILSKGWGISSGTRKGTTILSLCRQLLMSVKAKSPLKEDLAN